MVAKLAIRSERRDVLYTVGHGTLGAERFAEVLTAAGISHLVDVRSVPSSRHNPSFERGAMTDWLPAHGIAYRWEPDLGGFRRASKKSVNLGLRHPPFRGYADYMQTESFRAAFDRLLAEVGRTPTVIMCSETVWWRCHRRLIADAAVLLAEIDVMHLMHDGSLKPHLLTEPARLLGGSVTYVA